mgnify:CR=1 FL=1
MPEALTNQFTVTKDNCQVVMPQFNAQVWSLLKQGLTLKVAANEAENDRSLAQNRLLWLWHNESCKHIKDHWGVVCSPEALHEELIERLGYFKLERGVKRMVKVREKTSKMGVKRFTQLLNDYEHYALDVWKLQLPHPADMYHMAMGR